MTLRILSRLGNADTPTFAQIVDSIIGGRLDNPTNTVEAAAVAVAQTALTAAHLAELFVIRPALALVKR